jgi:hypothetical protein
MTDYQALVDNAVSLIQGARGFVVLCDSATNTCQYVATHDFIPDQNQYVDQMFFDLVSNGQPALMGNSITQTYRPSNAIRTLELRHVLIVPLNVNGLLWCDRPLKQGLLLKDDLATLVAMVQQAGL